MSRKKKNPLSMVFQILAEENYRHDTPPFPNAIPTPLATVYALRDELDHIGLLLWCLDDDYFQTLPDKHIPTTLKTLLL